RFVGIAEHWIEHDVHILRFEQNAGVTKVTPAHARSLISHIKGRWIRRQKRPDQPLRFPGHFQHLFDLSPRPWNGLQPEQFVYDLVIEWHAKVKKRIRFQPRRTEHEWAAISRQYREH